MTDTANAPERILYGGPVCPSCGERPTATSRHRDSMRRHSNCVRAMRQVQVMCIKGASLDEIRAVLDASIGPLPEDDVE